MWLSLFCERGFEDIEIVFITFAPFRWDILFDELRRSTVMVAKLSISKVKAALGKSEERADYGLICGFSSFM